jgi:SAM-dependent methyltransferase
MAVNLRYEHDADREQRWRTLIERCCVLADERTEADHVAPLLLDQHPRWVVEVGSNRGPIAEHLSLTGVDAVCVELDPEVVRLAHRPAVQATADALPLLSESVDAVTAMNVLYFLDSPVDAVSEAHRVLRPGGVFVACTQARDNDLELRDVVPGWGAPTTFDGDNAESIVRSVFDDVTVERWDQVMYRFESPSDIAEYLVVHHRMAVDVAHAAARGLPCPFDLTKRGLFVWGRKTR